MADKSISDEEVGMYLYTVTELANRCETTPWGN